MSFKAEQQPQIATAHETAATKSLIPAPQRKALNWQKAWLVPPPGLPQSTLDPNVPLRIQVTSRPGSRWSMLSQLGND